MPTPFRAWNCASAPHRAYLSSQAVAAARDQLPVVTTELQHCFPGCYSVMHEIKQAQRRGEHLLAQSERVADSLVQDPELQAALHTRIDAARDDLLFTQFHDILSGTSTPSAWGAVRALQGRARIGAEEVVVEATRPWARRALPPRKRAADVVIIPTPRPGTAMSPRSLRSTSTSWGNRWLSDDAGRPIPGHAARAV